MAYNYSTYFSTLQSLLVASDAGGIANLNAMLPNIIDYAELRIYRELDLLTTHTSLVSTTTAYNRNIAVPASLIVLESANIITPANTTPDNGTRNSMRRVSTEYINFAWPQTTTLGISPSINNVFALQNNNSSFSTTGSNYTMMIAPPPDSTYAVEFVCTVRPTPLSATNSVTFLTTYLPDLFLAASMVFASGYQRDFGSQSDDPKMAQSWESQYQLLKSGANIEELRRHSESQDWQAFNPTPIGDSSR